MKQQLQHLIQQAMQSLARAEPSTAWPVDIEPQLEWARQLEHGDFACNIAMLLAKPLSRNPRELASLIVAALPASELIAKVEIAGPGFINFYLNDAAFHVVVTEVLQQAEGFGTSDKAKAQRVLLEFGSANPTGPLHVGHGRHVAYGASLANILKAVGYDVHSEYYVNDAGRQMDILAASVWLRYLECCGESFVFPRNGYKGDYIRPIADTLFQQYGDRYQCAATKIFADIIVDEDDDGHGDKEAHIDAIIARAKLLLGADYAIIFDAALASILADIKSDLTEFGVHYQQWFSEKTLTTHGAIAHCIEVLRAQGHVYEQQGALWFKASAFGDEKDRVLVRENGASTYFASDVAYHLSKYERGFEKVIDILGADHHGYAARVKASIAALGKDKDQFIVLLQQFVSLYRGKTKVQMSTRSGSFVTLRELRQEVGNDAARLFYILRKREQHLDFDLELAASRSNENPVYYIQYAHARVCSVMRQCAERGLAWDQINGIAHLPALNTINCKPVFTLLARYPEMIELAAASYEPHLLAHYLRDLANAFHTYYNANTILVDQRSLRDANLCLINAVRQVIQNGLGLLGVSAPEQM